jgi:hypothetical protein
LTISFVRTDKNNEQRKHCYNELIFHKGFDEEINYLFRLLILLFRYLKSSGFINSSH